MKKVMNRIQIKLNSNRGVSILFAMVLFLFVSIMGATIISAAHTSAIRVHNNASAIQSNLTLQSASKIVKEELLNSNVQVIEDDENVQMIVSENAFSKELRTLMEQLQSIPNQNASTTFTIHSNQLDDIQGMIVCKHGEQNDSAQDYQLVVTLQTNSNEMMYITFQCNQKMVKETKDVQKTRPNGTVYTVQVTTIVNTYTWDSFRISQNIEGSSL